MRSIDFCEVISKSTMYITVRNCKYLFYHHRKTNCEFGTMHMSVIPWDGCSPWVESAALLQWSANRNNTYKIMRIKCILVQCMQNCISYWLLSDGLLWPTYCTYVLSIEKHQAYTFNSLLNLCIMNVSKWKKWKKAQVLETAYEFMRLTFLTGTVRREYASAKEET